MALKIGKTIAVFSSYCDISQSNLVSTKIRGLPHPLSVETPPPQVSLCSTIEGRYLKVNRSAAPIIDFAISCSNFVPNYIQVHTYIGIPTLAFSPENSKIFCCHTKQRKMVVYLLKKPSITRTHQCQLPQTTCLQRTRLVVKWRHLVITFSVEEFYSISQIKSFLLQCSELAQLKLGTNLPYLTASN